MLTVSDLPREVIEWMEGAIGVDRLEIRDDAYDRLFGYDAGNRVYVTVLLRPVGPDYSGAYRGWVTLRKGDRMAALAGRPADVQVVYAMAGIAPDGRLWWVALYDEATLPIGEAEEMRSGLFYRLTPQQVDEALIAPEYDLIQPSLGLLVDAPSTPEPVDTRVALESVEVGSRVRAEGVVIRKNRGGSVTVRFDKGKEWAILGLTPVWVIEDK